MQACDYQASSAHLGPLCLGLGLLCFFFWVGWGREMSGLCRIYQNRNITAKFPLVFCSQESCQKWADTSTALSSPYICLGSWSI